MGRSRRQSLLWVKDLAEGLSPHVAGKRKIREIPKGQRFAGRPALAKIFSQKSGQKELRNQLIVKAVAEYGYSQMELANHLKLHYSTISRIVTASAQQER